jgi:hypothetical protein
MAGQAALNVKTQNDVATIERKTSPSRPHPAPEQSDRRCHVWMPTRLDRAGTYEADEKWLDREMVMEAAAGFIEPQGAEL